MKLTHLNHSLTRLYAPDRVFHILFSGGVDSVAVAHFLSRGPKNFVELWHYNHGLEGDDLIEAKCGEFAKAFDIPINVVITDKIKPAKRSVEDFCREMRYGFFCQYKRNFLVCHHLDDAVENYITNCMSGVPNYVPIPRVLNMGDASFYRPFLLNKKAELVKYCEDRDLNKYIAHDPYTKLSRRAHIRNAIAELAKGNLVAYKAVKKLYS